VSDWPFAARPAVLRCGRCGRFADWNDARLQVVCGCRGRIELPPVLVREPTADDRRSALQLFAREFGGRPLVADGVPVSLAEVSLLVAETDGGITGALAWRGIKGGLHVVAMATDPMWQRAGVGGQLLAEIELLARQQLRPRVVVTMTNDNIPALYFYQRRGYRLARVLPGGVAAHLREAEQAAGFAGIPIRDEIQLVKEV
jgi:GNAT superfamily N-acetyltransferase